MKKSTQQKRLIFLPGTFDLKEFESLAASAKDTGFTHIGISCLTERTDFGGDDKDSPWCEWSALLPSIFKYVTPPGLEEAFPADFVKRQMANLKARHRIVQKLRLRAAFFGVEPHWLSDRVYRKHPQWRGSRADNSLRSVGMHYAPNTDHPEVREAYRRAVKEMVRQCPALDLFTFHTNDAGAFFPWAKRQFTSPNGPTDTIGRDMGERVVGLLSAMRAGALDAGGDAWFYVDCHYWFGDDEAHLIRKSLKPGVGIHGLAPEPLTREHSLLSCGGWGETSFLSMGSFHRFPTPMDVVDTAATVNTSKAGNLAVGGSTQEFFTAFKIALKSAPAIREPQKLATLARMAAEMYAPDVVDDVVDAWYALDRAQTMMAVSGVGTRTPVMLRWLVRPLVAHQELLTAEERAYWEPFLYQSRDSQPDKYLDYVNAVGYPIVYEWEDATRLCIAIDNIEAAIKSSADKLQAAVDKTASKEAARKLQMDVYRIRALRCVVLTTRHFVQMGTLIQIRDRQAKQWVRQHGEPMPSTNPPRPDLPKGSMGDTGLFYMHRAMRWELDNTYELIDLVKKAGEPLLFTSKEYEGDLIMGPNLLEQLQKKVDIMLKHWRTTEQGWFRPTLGG
jgi:hypothetical protein